MANQNIFSHNLKVKIVMLKGPAGSPGTPGGTYSGEYYANGPRIFYVDGANGNDNNNGSKDNPFKTADKAFSMLNSVSPNLQIHFKTAGNYDINWAKVTSASLILTGDVDGVVVRFRDAVTYAEFRNCFLRLENVSFGMANSGGELEFFNTTVETKTKAALPSHITAFGSQLKLLNTSVSYIDVSSGSVVETNNTTVINGGFSRPAVFRVRFGSTLVIRGTSTIEEPQSESPGYLIQLEQSSAYLSGTIVNNTSNNRFTNAVRTSGGILQATSSILDALAATSTSGNLFANTLRILGNSTIGG